MSNLLYSDLVSSDFSDKVISIGSDLGVNPNWLMLMMKHESGLNPQARNNIGAIGLIQFVPSTAAALGITASMSALDQLDIVKKYFAPFAGKIKSYADLHLIGFFPAALGKPDEWVLEAAGIDAGLIAKQNFPIDLNGDGVITAGEARTYFNNFALREVPAEFLNEFNTVKKYNAMEKTINIMVAVALVVLVAASVYNLYKNW